MKVTEDNPTKTRLQPHMRTTTDLLSILVLYLLENNSFILFFFFFCISKRRTGGRSMVTSAGVRFSPSFSFLSLIDSGPFPQFSLQKLIPILHYNESAFILGHVPAPSVVPLHVRLPNWTHLFTTSPSPPWSSSSSFFLSSYYDMNLSHFYNIGFASFILKKSY